MEFKGEVAKKYKKLCCGLLGYTELVAEEKKGGMKNATKEITHYNRAYVGNISTWRLLLSFVFRDGNMEEELRSFWKRLSSLVTGMVSRPKNSMEPHLKFPWVSEASQVSRNFEDYVFSCKGSLFA